VGTLVTIRGSGFAPTANVLKFGSGYVPLCFDSEPEGTALRFAVPGEIQGCAPASRGPCPLWVALVGTGGYPVAVISNEAASNSFVFTVTPP
jgi:hypothetical protein